MMDAAKALLPSTSLPGNGIIGGMRILHTADWHLGDRLGRIDRTDDLRRADARSSLACLWECPVAGRWRGFA